MLKQGRQPLLPCRPCTDARRGADVVGLQEFTEYEARARARSSKGASDWSRPLRVLTRRRAVGGGCDCGLYSWTQTCSEVAIHVAVSRDDRPACVTLEVPAQSMRL